MIVDLVRSGLSVKEARGTTFCDYEIYMMADWMRQEEKLALHRDVLATFMNFGGMGLEKPISGQELIPLPITDNINSDEINTMTKAKELLKYIASN